MRLYEIYRPEGWDSISNVSGQIKRLRHTDPSKGAIAAVTRKMKKAYDAGFRVKAYHGTRKAFERFSGSAIGYHFGSADQAWERLAGTAPRSGGDRRSNIRILPVLLRIKKAAYMDDAGDWESPEQVMNVSLEGPASKRFEPGLVADLEDIQYNINKFYKKLPDKYSERVKQEDEGRQTFLTDIRLSFEAYGYNSIVYTNTGEVAGRPSYLMFDGSDVRGFFAELDPDKSTSDSFMEGTNTVVDVGTIYDPERIRIV